MRIGIDCRLWQETGVGRYIRNLVVQLQQIDSVNTYVLFAKASDQERIKQLLRWRDFSEEQKSNSNYQIVIADMHWHSFEEQLLFPQIIKQNQIDLMHFPYFSVPLFYNDPFVVTIHDLIINYYPTGKASTLPLPQYYAKRFAYNLVINHAVKKSKQVIVPLHAVKQDLVTMFDISSDKVFVTYEGIDENFQASTGSDNKKIKKEKYFLHVGNVYPHKNCERLIDAFSKVVKEFPDSKLIFVGKEDYFMQRLQTYVKNKDLQDQVHFLGLVSDERLSAYYHNAISLVVPSLMEGFGLPALEAMSSSCLVIAADIPSLYELCSDAALYCNQLSIEDIANTMRKAIQLAAKERSNKIRLGIKRCTQFSWQKMTKETLRIYESSPSV